MNPPDERSDGDGATTESFAYKYRRLTTPVAQAMRSAAMGSALPNGYTTVAQAERMAKALHPEEGDLLLDLGSGRGWPGIYIGAATGCVPVTADLPLEALRSARAELQALTPPRGSAVAADGLRLPFRDRSFDAACHTDVLC